jgi:hypothetical protein
MNKIIKGRQQGKTTELIKRSAETGTYILVADRKRVQQVYRQAESMHLNIPYPVTVEEYMQSGFRGSFINSILIDDADDVLSRVFSNVRIDTITMSE